MRRLQGIRRRTSTFNIAAKRLVITHIYTHFILMNNFTSIITFNPHKQEWHYRLHFEDKEANARKSVKSYPDP